MRRCHTVTVIYIIFKYFPFAVLPLLSEFIIFLRDGIFRPLSIYYSSAAMIAVIAYAVSAWRATTYRADGINLTVQKGVFIKRRTTIPIKNIAYCGASHELLSIFRAQRIAVDTIAGSKKHHDIWIFLSDKKSYELFNELGEDMEEKRELRPSLLKIIILAATVSHSASGLLLLSPILSALSKLLDISFSQQLYGQADRLARYYLSAIPPILGAAAILLLFGWLISFAVNFQRYFGMKVLRSRRMTGLKSGFIFPKREAVKSQSIAAVSVRQTLIDYLFGLGTVYLNAPGFAKGHNGGLFLPIQSKKELKNAKVPLSCFKRKSSGIATERFAWYKLIMVPLLIALGIVILTLYISFIYEGPLGVTLLLSFVGLSICGRQILLAAAEYKHGSININGDKINIISRRKGRLCAVSVRLCRASIKIRRTIFQRMDGTCTIIVKIQSELPDIYKVRHVNFKKMMDICHRHIR